MEHNHNNYFNYFPKHLMLSLSNFLELFITLISVLPKGYYLTMKSGVYYLLSFIIFTWIELTSNRLFYFFVYLVKSFAPIIWYKGMAKRKCQIDKTSIWWHKITLDDTWWHLMTLDDDSWWLLMTLDDFWWLLMTV